MADADAETPVREMSGPSPNRYLALVHWFEPHLLGEHDLRPRRHPV